MRLIVLLLILSLAIMAAIVGLHAKPAGAEVVCKPTPFNDVTKAKRIVRA